MKILKKSCFYKAFQLKSIIDNLQPSCLIKEMPFPFILITFAMWITIYHVKYFCASVGSEILRIVRITTGLIKMVIRINILLTWIKK